MTEHQDPLRSLFQQAARVGQAHSAAAPVAYIAERARRGRRRKIAGLAVAACLALGGGVATAVALLPDRPPPHVPATSPSPRPLPAPTRQAPEVPFPGRETTGTTPGTGQSGSPTASAGEPPVHTAPPSASSTGPGSTTAPP